MFIGLSVTPWNSLIPNQFSPKRIVNIANCVFHAILQPLQWHIYFHNIISFNSTQVSGISFTPIWTYGLPCTMFHKTNTEHHCVNTSCINVHSNQITNLRNSFTCLRKYSFYCTNSNKAHNCWIQFCPYFLHQILSTLEEKYNKSTINKACLSIHQFSHNSQMLNSITCRSSI